MKLITFSHAGFTRLGVVTSDNEVIDLNYAYQFLLENRGSLRAEMIAEAYVPAEMKGFLEGGNESLSLVQEIVEFALQHPTEYKHKLVHAFDEVKLEAPVQNPEKIICVGHNYREHILEMGRELPTEPVIFAKFSNTLISPQDDIPFFPISEQLDYEAEFAFVIGKRARNVSREDALEYVAGYTIANDVTYRDIQRRTLQWLQGKTVEGSLPIGPWIP